MKGVAAMTEPHRVLNMIDDVLVDWDRSADSMRWHPDPIEDADRAQVTHLAAVARLVAAHTDATVEDALEAVRDVNKYGPDTRGWALCFAAMRTALAQHVDPILAKVPPEAHEEQLRKLTPSMVSAFVQMAASD